MGWTRGTTIGRGSSATVSIATAHGSGDVFAVKSTELSKSDTLQREQQLLSTLNCCPQIITYKGWNISTENGKSFYNLLMEYAANGSLFETINQTSGGLNEETIKSYTREILLGLEYLHTKGIVHCDIKSKNILMSDKGVKIADLGCAKKVEAEDGFPIVGTPLFMAPEVARGEQQGLAADVWALGCVVIEMATGRQPWLDVFDPIIALYRIGFTTDVPEIPSFLSEEGKDFISKCLKRDPLERWSVAELLNHDFMKKVKSLVKEINDFDLESPTSVLDDGLRDSVEDFEKYPSRTQKIETKSVNERFRKLCLCAGNVTSFCEMDYWTSDEDWVTVRENSYKEPNGPHLYSYNEPTNKSPEYTTWTSKCYNTTWAAVHKKFSVSNVPMNYKIDIRNNNSCRDSDLKSGSSKASNCSTEDVFCDNLNFGNKELRIFVHVDLIYFDLICFVYNLSFSPNPL